MPDSPAPLPRNWMPTVLCWGGIGDTIRNIGLLPHAQIYRATGGRFRVVHKNWREALCLPHAGAPEPEVFEAFIKRIPSLEWRGESREHRGLSRWLNRLLRDVIHLLNGGRVRYFPFTVELTAEERAALPPRPAGLHIGLQTHLSGMKTKRWGVANWRSVIEHILRTFPGATIRLLDADAEVESLCVDSRVTSTRGFNIAQSINLIAQLDLLVSLESWTKYIAAIHHIPQVIIVPDMTSEYGASTAEKLSRVELAGIIDEPHNLVLGIEGRGAASRLTIPDITAFAPATLCAAIDQALAKLNSRS